MLLRVFRSSFVPADLPSNFKPSTNNIKIQALKVMEKANDFAQKIGSILPIPLALALLYTWKANEISSLA